MSEKDTIFEDSLPLTVDSLAEQLAACGLSAGHTVLVHSSMSRLGWVNGGPVAVIQALLHVLGPQGTLMMPSHTGENSDPRYWQNPPVPEHWWPIIRETRPAYDPAMTPTRGMGVIAELFRTWPGVIRSLHPIGSFAAIGPNAACLTEGPENVGDMFGDNSPLGRLYALDGYVLLLGVGHGNNTSLHLAEHRAEWPGKRTYHQGTAMFVHGVRQWVEFEELDINDDDFEEIGALYEKQHTIHPCKVGKGDARYFRQVPIVDFAVQWMGRNRNTLREDS